MMRLTILVSDLGGDALDDHDTIGLTKVKELPSRRCRPITAIASGSYVGILN